MEKVKFSYDGDRLALSGINLNIKEGEFISVLGPNGSGKSTLLKLLSGYLKPTRGEVKFNGQSIFEISTKEKAKIISYVPQNNAVVYPFTVYEIVAMGRSPYLNFFGYATGKDSVKIKNALEIMGISRLAKKSVKEISGGELQRTFIARALAQESKVILLDEANAHLDLKHQIAIYKVLKELNVKKGITVVFVSHELNLPAHFSNRMILLKQGEIFKDGTVNEVLTAGNIEEVFGVKAKIIKEEGSTGVLLRVDNV